MSARLPEVGPPPAYLGTLLVLVIIFVVPLAVYGLFTVVAGLKEPARSGRFLVSVLVQKVGTAIAFVVLFDLARDYFGEHWVQYGGIWLMFAITEVGQTIGPDYSVKEAAAVIAAVIAGVISEAIYFASAWIVATLLG